MQDKIYEQKNTSPKLVYRLGQFVLTVGFTYFLFGLHLNEYDCFVATSFCIASCMMGNIFGYAALAMIPAAFFSEDIILMTMAVMNSVGIIIFAMFSQKRSHMTYALWSMNINLLCSVAVYRIYSLNALFLLNGVISSAAGFLCGAVFADLFSEIKHRKDHERFTPREEISFLIANAILILSLRTFFKGNFDIATAVIIFEILYFGRYLKGRCMPVGFIYSVLGIIFHMTDQSTMAALITIGYFAALSGRMKYPAYFFCCISGLCVVGAVMRVSAGYIIWEFFFSIIIAAIFVPLKDKYASSENIFQHPHSGLMRQSMDSLITNEISLAKKALRSLADATEQDEISSDIYTDVCRSVVSDVCMKCGSYPVCWIENGKMTFEYFKKDIEELTSQDGYSPSFTDRCSEDDKKKIRDHILMSYISLKTQNDYKSKTSVFIRTYRLLLEHLCSMLDTVELTLRKNLTFYSDASGEILSIMQENGIEADDVMISSDMSGEVRAVIKSRNPLGESTTQRKIRNILASYVKRDFSFSYSREPAGNEGYLYAYTEDYERSLKFAFSCRSKEGEDISGDSVLLKEFSHMQFCAICDGMGSGNAAGIQSRKVISMIDSLLCAGYDYENAVDMINGILSFNGINEIFTTLDMLLYDRKSSNAVFFKAGAESAYIKRGDEIIKIKSETLPIGILESTHTKSVIMPLKKGDYVFMFSDGLVSAFGYNEEYIKSLIRGSSFRLPQKIADEILHLAIEMTGGEAKDDISVVVGKLR